MLIEAKSGHTAGPLDMADVFTYLYFHALKHEPKNPDWPYRDIVVLSNGHICPVLYATMAHAGYFPVKELMTLRKLGSRLQGHPHRDWLPQLETSSGPLGCGLSQAVGMAIADRMDNGVSSSKNIVCLMSDGELDEGNSWEAIALAGKEKLQNLTVILDRNNIQIDGFTETILPLEPLPEKWLNSTGMFKKSPATISALSTKHGIKRKPCPVGHRSSSPILFLQKAFPNSSANRNGMASRRQRRRNRRSPKSARRDSHTRW